MAAFGAAEAPLNTPAERESSRDFLVTRKCLHRTGFVDVRAKHAKESGDGWEAYGDG
jgi:hypothetical protein